MMNESEQAMAVLEQQVSLGKKMQELQKDASFKEIFMDGYIAGTAKDIAEGFCLLDERRLERATKDLYATSFFNQFMSALVDNGNNAVESIRDLQETMKFEQQLKES